MNLLHLGGVRNYQARNSIRDTMAKGDFAFFYHSNCDEPGIAGIAEISRKGYPDPSQFDENHRYYDDKSDPDEPRWFSFDVKWKRRFGNFVHLKELKSNARLADMQVVQRGQRLSIQAVSKQEWHEVCKIGGVAPG